MNIGLLREIKSDESRVALLPVGVDLLTDEGHTVHVQRGAGLASGFEDAEYERAGATLVDAPEAVLERSELIVHVKEPQPNEIALMRPGQLVFSYFHFAASRDLTEQCLKAKITALAYETLRDPRGGLPLLTPMSEVAGKMSIQEGAKYLEKPQMGRGILLGGVAGVAPANVLVLGAGVVGANAARVAAGLGARVVLMDINIERLRHLDEVMPPNVSTVYSDPHAIQHYLQHADLVIGAVLIPGGRAPYLVRREHLASMKTGAVIVDVSIDQGGCIETAEPTTHQQPTYPVDGVVHYCVTNIPGAVGRTSSQALCNATLPYVRGLAAAGVGGFAGRSDGHAAAINLRDGRITHPAVAEAFPDLPGVTV